MTKEEFIQTALISNMQGFIEASGIKGEIAVAADAEVFVGMSLRIAETMWAKYIEKYG